MTQDLNERVELQTERLLLRPFDFRDVDDVLSYASEPEFGRYLPVPQPYTRDDAVEFVAHRVLAEWSTRPHFAMVYERHVVGGVGLRVYASDERAELGYALSKQHWARDSLWRRREPLLAGDSRDTHCTRSTRAQT